MRKKAFKISGIILTLVGIAGCLLSAFNIDKHPDKLWLHRCNTVEKFIEKSPRYPNVEIDVVFRKDNRFDVTHDVSTSYALPLDSILAQSPRDNGRHFWLDIKNMDSTNRDDILDEMERLRARYRLDKRQFILESPEWRLLEPFTRQGYYTSCYVTYDKPSRLERQEIKERIARLRKVVDSHAVSALSFPGWWYTTIKKYLRRPIDLLTWKHRTTQFELFLTPIGWKMLKDRTSRSSLSKTKESITDKTDETAPKQMILIKEETRSFAFYSYLWRDETL